MKNEQLIYGARPIIEAIEAGKEIEKLFIQKSSTSPIIRELLQKVRPFGTPIQMVPVEKLNSMTRGNHQGVVAFLSMIAYQPIEEIVTNLFEKGKNPFQLDSKEPAGDFQAFLKGEVRYSSLERSFPEEAVKLFAKTEKEAKARYAKYQALAK